MNKLLLYVDDATKGELEALQTKVGCKSLAELIKKSCALMSVMHDSSQDGNVVILDQRQPTETFVSFKL